jgi:hypothetical protein
MKSLLSFSLVLVLCVSASAQRIRQGFDFGRINLSVCLVAHRGNNLPFGLYKDTAMTIPATTAGDAIAAWRDEVTGNGLYATQATAGFRPTLQFVSGRPVVRFDGTDDYLEFPTIGPLALTSGFEVQARVITGSVAFNVSGGEQWIFSKDVDTGRSYAFGWGGQFPLQINGTGSSLPLALSGPVSLGWRGNSTLGTLWRAAGTDYVNNATWAAPATNATLPRIGLRQYPGFTQPFSGDLVSVTVASKVLTTYQRLGIEAYVSGL